MADKRVIRLQNPRNPDKPFVRVANRSTGVRWASCNSTGGMGRGRGGGGGGGGAPQAIREVQYIFRFDHVPLSTQRYIETTIGQLRERAGQAIAAGGAVALVSLLAAGAGFMPGVVSFAGGVVFLFGGLITLTFAEFAQFAAYQAVVYVRFTTPCTGGNEGV